MAKDKVTYVKITFGTLVAAADKGCLNREDSYRFSNGRRFRDDEWYSKVAVPEDLPWVSPPLIAPPEPYEPPPGFPFTFPFILE